MNVLTEKQISEVVNKFYERVRADDQLGPVFSVVDDWDEHLMRLGEFWSSVAIMSGKYKGNPVSMHLVHSDRIRPEMFDRWLDLWRATSNEILLPAEAELMQVKASRIAARLSVAIFGKPIAPANEEVKELRPYRISSEFSEDSIPAQLLRNHSLKAGAWGVIRMTHGKICYREESNARDILDRGRPRVVMPATPHHLEIIGPFRLRIEFYDRDPSGLFKSLKGTI